MNLHAINLRKWHQSSVWMEFIWSWLEKNTETERSLSMKRSVRVQVWKLLHTLTAQQFPPSLLIHINTVASISSGKAQCIPNLSLPLSAAVYILPSCCHSPHFLLERKERARHSVNKVSLSYFPHRKHSIWYLLSLVSPALLNKLIPKGTAMLNLWPCNHSLAQNTEERAVNLLFNKWVPEFLQIYVSPGLMLLWAGHGKSAIFVKVWNVFRC